MCFTVVFKNNPFFFEDKSILICRMATCFVYATVELVLNMFFIEGEGLHNVLIGFLVEGERLHNVLIGVLVERERSCTMFSLSSWWRERSCTMYSVFVEREGLHNVLGRLSHNLCSRFDRGRGVAQYTQ